MVWTSEHFVADGGLERSCRCWKAKGGPVGKAILLVSPRQLPIQRLTESVEALSLPAFTIFQWGTDASSDGGANVTAAESELDLIARFVAEQAGGIENVAIVAQGVEAAFVAAWLHDYAPRVRGVTLAHPALRANVPENASDQAQTGAIGLHSSCALIWGPGSLTPLAGWETTLPRVAGDAQAIQAPVQVLVPEADERVDLKAEEQFFERLGSRLKQKDVCSDRDGERPLDRAKAFLSRVFAEQPHRDSLIDNDRHGYTKEEFDRFEAPLPLFSKLRMRFAFENCFMKTVGRLSTGIRIGLTTGFDSGSTMDYVYRCEPSGWTSLGRSIDALYLNSAGWQAIRVRRRNLQKLLAQAAGRLAAQGQPVRIVDIAAGHGRYLMEAVAELETKPEHILLRDYNASDVLAGRALLQQYGLEHIADFEAADAFDYASIVSIRPRPTLAVVCGLYELFPENGLVRRSLSGLAAVMEPGGFLICTGLPWHPELEFIARVLPSHRKNHRCGARRRTQAELDQLIESEGFVKTSQLIDEWGIFTVSVARRTGKQESCAQS